MTQQSTDDIKDEKTVERAPSNVALLFWCFLIPIILFCIFILPFIKLLMEQPSYEKVLETFGLSYLAYIGLFITLTVIFYLVAKSIVGTYRTNIELVRLNREILKKLDK